MGGLNDRLSALRGAGNLAASLCARLVVPQPCQMLDPRHNKGMRVDCSIGWERYMHATMLKDDSQMMVPIRNARSGGACEMGTGPNSRDATSVSSVVAETQLRNS